MTLYVDSSAFLKRYVDEHDSDTAVHLMGTDPVLVTSRLTEVEVRFVPLAEGGTRVELEHRLLENMGEKADATAAMLGSEEGGWGGILSGFGAVLDAPG